MKRAFVSIAALVVLALALPASAQWGSGAGLYTDNGIEVSVDARVFAVFALLNANGYDKDLEGPPPLYRPQHSEARTSTRRRFGRPGAATRSFADAVKKTPAPPADYVEAALALGAAPKFSRPNKGKIARAIAKPVASWFNEEGGAAIFRKVSGTLKSTQKKMLDPIGKLAKKAGEHVRVAADDDDILAAEESGPSGRVVVVLNELDQHNTLNRVQMGDKIYIVTGPRTGKEGNDPVVRAAALAYAHTLVADEAQKQQKAPLVGQVWKLLDKGTKKGFSKKALAAELVACGLLRAASKGSCTGSPIAGNEKVEALLPALDERIKAYIGDDSKMLVAALPELLAKVEAPAAGAKKP